jgi:hypothetical protein
MRRPVDDRNLILPIDPSPQIHELAPLGAERKPARQRLIVRHIGYGFFAGGTQHRQPFYASIGAKSQLKNRKSRPGLRSRDGSLGESSLTVENDACVALFAYTPGEAGVAPKCSDVPFRRNRQRRDGLHLADHGSLGRRDAESLRLRFLPCVGAPACNTQNRNPNLFSPASARDRCALRYGARGDAQFQE